MRLAAELLPTCEIASHTHCVASLVIAARLSKPCMVVVREPIAAISSYVVRYNRPIEEAVEEYKTFNGYAASQPRVMIVDFAALTDTPAVVLQRLAAFRGFDLGKEEAVAMAERVFHQIDTTRKAQLKVGKELTIGWKTEEKEQKKRALEGSIAASAGIRDCRRIFEDMKAVASKVPKSPGR